MTHSTAGKSITRRPPGTRTNQQLRSRASPDGIPEKLPLVHVTATGTAREIVASTKLEVRPCNVFKDKNLLYFFSLRPAYRRKDGDQKSDSIDYFPFVFIVKPEAVATPYHVYPFDTGGASAGVFGNAVNEHVFLEDYELEPTHAAVAGQIGWAFRTVMNYLKGDLRHDLLDGVPDFQTVVRGYHGIAGLARMGSNQPDKRASAIEVATNRDVSLKGNVMLAIIPRQYLESASVKNLEFMDELKSLEIEWETYDWQPNTMPNEMQDEIARITEEWYRKKGLI